MVGATSPERGQCVVVVSFEHTVRETRREMVVARMASNVPALSDALPSIPASIDQNILHASGSENSDLSYRTLPLYRAILLCPDSFSN